MADSWLLEVRDVVKTFPGVRALDGVGFTLRAGEVHALVGENGAGKSTLMHLLGGVGRPDSGQILLEGRPVRLASAAVAARHGISVVFQELSLARNLSIAENIFFNRQPTRRLGLIDWPKLHEQTRQALKLFELVLDPATPVRRLSVALRQVIEILKAIVGRPRVLILDEPTSSLTAIETRLLFRNIRELKARGVSIIYISHHLPEIFEIADRVTVLRDGRHVATRPVAEVTEEQLVRLMVGRELSDIYGTRGATAGDGATTGRGAAGREVLRLEDATRAGAFEGISLSLRAGEMVGLAGLVGAGRTELARAIFGAEPLTRGRMVLDGREVRIRRPAEAIRHQIGYMTEDRKEQGLFAGMSLRENCIAPNLRAFTNRLGWLDERRIDRFAEDGRRRYRIATPSVRQRARNLSGGNQQKALLAMWVGIGPKVLIVDEPTRGVDVGARGEIYQMLRELAGRGVAILLISSDLPEVLGLCDRVLVLRGGRLAGEFDRAEANEENIIACASGVTLTGPTGKGL